MLSIAVFDPADQDLQSYRCPRSSPPREQILLPTSLSSSVSILSMLLRCVCVLLSAARFCVFSSVSAVQFTLQHCGSCPLCSIFCSSIAHRISSLHCPRRTVVAIRCGDLPFPAWNLSRDWSRLVCYLVVVYQGRHAARVYFKHVAFTNTLRTPAGCHSDKSLVVLLSCRVCQRQFKVETLHNFHSSMNPSEFQCGDGWCPHYFRGAYKRGGW